MRQEFKKPLFDLVLNLLWCSINLWMQFETLSGYIKGSFSSVFKEFPQDSLFFLSKLHAILQCNFWLEVFWVTVIEACSPQMAHCMVGFNLLTVFTQWSVLIAEVEVHGNVHTDLVGLIWWTLLPFHSLQPGGKGCQHSFFQRILVKLPCYNEHN